MILVILLVAAVLEAGGDALVRAGLRSASVWRPLLFAMGGAVLFLYGYLVNTPDWNFGRLLGVYVVLFFLVAQAISWVAFKQTPDGSTMVGGAFIVAGGLIMSYR